MKKLVVSLPVTILILLGLIRPATSEEYSMIKDSTVLGQNFGYPSGTPRQSQTTIGDIDLVFETAVFMKNLELTGFEQQTGIEGETFIGFLVPIRGRYRAHESLTFELGAVFGQNFGDEDELDIAEPLARLVYEPRKDLYLVAGTILPTHWIHDAILDDAQKLRTNAEQGFQARINFERLKHETWINWRIREDELTPEEFEVGTASQLRLLGRALRLNAELLWAHVGGQKNQSRRVEHNIVLLGGASYGFAYPLDLEFLDELRIGGNYLYSIDQVRGIPEQHGAGYEFFATMDIHPRSNVFLRFHGSYFDGDEFLARRGDPLYGLDKYGQLGAVAIFSLPAGLRIETGIVGQYNKDSDDDLLNYTFQINFTWGEAFVPSFLRPRTADN